MNSSMTSCAMKQEGPKVVSGKAICAMKHVRPQLVGYVRQTMCEAHTYARQTICKANNMRGRQYARQTICEAHLFCRQLLIDSDTNAHAADTGGRAVEFLLDFDGCKDLG